MRPHSVGKVLAPETLTTLFIVPTRSLANLKTLYVRNNAVSAKTVSVWWYDKSEDFSIPIVLDYPITSKEFLLLDGNTYIVLDEGDEVRAESEAGSNTSIIITVEIDPRASVQNFA